MSELKTYDFPVDHGDFTATVELFYIKSEADKVIAELQNESDVYKAKYEQEYDIAVHNEKQLSSMRIEIRHHKYKRCMAMADYCFARSVAEDELHTNRDGIEHSDYWLCRHKMWLELAEKFKEAK